MSDEQRVILCIDDDPDILEYLQVVLEAEGYTFVSAESAEDGIQRYKEVSPDLVIVDLMMEEVDAGTGFAREMQVLRNEAPVYLLSSVGDSLNMATDYDELGLAGIFQKPISKNHLLAVLRAKLPIEETV